jgi:hypothetical protein
MKNLTRIITMMNRNGRSLFPEGEMTKYFTAKIAAQLL